MLLGPFAVLERGRGFGSLLFLGWCSHLLGGCWLEVGQLLLAALVPLLSALPKRLAEGRRRSLCQAWAELAWAGSVKVSLKEQLER